MRGRVIHYPFDLAVHYKPFDAAAQGLDSSEYFGLGVWHDGPTLDEIQLIKDKNIKGYTFNPTLFRSNKVINYLQHCKKLF